jgi:hypothetical protein
MTRWLTRLFGLALMLGLSACATSFTGSAHVDNGRSGCEAKCKGEGMELAGMVYMGEYSDACVCAVPGKSASARHDLLASAAVAGGASGVVMQMRRNEENDRNNNALVVIH